MTKSKKGDFFWTIALLQISLYNSLIETYAPESELKQPQERTGKETTETVTVPCPILNYLSFMFREWLSES